MYWLKVKEMEKINTMNRVTNIVGAPLSISLSYRPGLDNANDEGFHPQQVFVMSTRMRTQGNGIWMKPLSSKTLNIMKKLKMLNWIYNSRLYQDTNEVLNDVDYYSRRVFPAIFFILNILYWTFYIYIL